MPEPADTKQTVILTSYESLRKLRDANRNHEDVNDIVLCRITEISVERATTDESGRLPMAPSGRGSSSSMLDGAARPSPAKQHKGARTRPPASGLCR
jgi:hypothetical protein